MYGSVECPTRTPTRRNRSILVFVGTLGVFCVVLGVILGGKAVIHSHTELTTLYADPWTRSLDRQNLWNSDGRRAGFVKYKSAHLAKLAKIKREEERLEQDKALMRKEEAELRSRGSLLPSRSSLEGDRRDDRSELDSRRERSLRQPARRRGTELSREPRRDTRLRQRRDDTELSGPRRDTRLRQRRDDTELSEPRRDTRLRKRRDDTELYERRDTRLRQPRRATHLRPRRDAPELSEPRRDTLRQRTDAYSPTSGQDSLDERRQEQLDSRERSDAVSLRAQEKFATPELDQDTDADERQLREDEAQLAHASKLLGSVSLPKVHKAAPKIQLASEQPRPAENTAATGQLTWPQPVGGRRAPRPQLDGEHLLAKATAELDAADGVSPAALMRKAEDAAADKLTYKAQLKNRLVANRKARLQNYVDKYKEAALAQKFNEVQGKMKTDLQHVRQLFDKDTKISVLDSTPH